MDKYYQKYTNGNDRNEVTAETRILPDPEFYFSNKSESSTLKLILNSFKEFIVIIMLMVQDNIIQKCQLVT